MKLAQQGNGAGTPGQIAAGVAALKRLQTKTAADEILKLEKLKSEIESARQRGVRSG